MRFRSLFIIVLFVCCGLVFAQGDKKGLKLINLSVGSTFSNFLNSEAPHKFSSDVNSELLFVDYNTSLIKDVKVGLSVGIGFEYFLKNSVSIYTSLLYEEKGINLNYSKHESSIHEFVQNPPYALPIPEPPTNIAYYEEKYEVKISNNYLVLPILLRKYIRQKGFYFQGGLYAGYLLQSQIYSQQGKRAYIPNYEFYGYEYLSTIDVKDEEKEFTSNIDFGVSFGTGISHSISKRFFLNANLLLNVGLIKVDGKYHNEYSEDTLPLTTGYNTVIHSTNYYGLNSYSKNINCTLSVGLVYML